MLFKWGISLSTRPVTGSRNLWQIFLQDRESLCFVICCRIFSQSRSGEHVCVLRSSRNWGNLFVGAFCSSPEWGIKSTPSILTRRTSCSITCHVLEILSVLQLLGTVVKRLVVQRTAQRTWSVCSIVSTAFKAEIWQTELKERQHSTIHDPSNSFRRRRQIRHIVSENCECYEDKLIPIIGIIKAALDSHSSPVLYESIGGTHTPSHSTTVQLILVLTKL